MKLKKNVGSANAVRKSALKNPYFLPYKLANFYHPHISETKLSYYKWVMNIVIKYVQNGVPVNLINSPKIVKRVVRGNARVRDINNILFKDHDFVDYILAREALFIVFYWEDNPAFDRFIKKASASRAAFLVVNLLKDGVGNNDNIGNITLGTNRRGDLVFDHPYDAIHYFAAILETIAVN